MERERLAEMNVRDEGHMERHVRFEEVGSEAGYDSDREAEGERTVTFEELGSFVDVTGLDADFNTGFGGGAEKPVQRDAGHGGGGNAQW